MYGLFQRKDELLNILKKFRLLIFTQCTSNVNTFKAIQFQIIQKRSKFFDTSMVELNYEKARPACISLSIELHD